MNDEIWTIEETLEELHRFASHFAPAIEDDNNFYRGGCDIDGKDAAVIGMMCQNAIRLLADRAVDTTVAEPDAETVERVAKALYELEPAGEYLTDDPIRMGWEPYAWEEMDADVQDQCRRQARAAIAAMPSGADADDEPWLGPRDKGVTVKATVVEADDVPMFPDLGADADNWLDAALDSVHPGCEILHVSAGIGNGIRTAQIWWPGQGCSLTGTGPTRKAAILDAEKKAKKGESDGN